jgi:glutathione S-transferase
MDFLPKLLGLQTNEMSPKHFLVGHNTLFDVAYVCYFTRWSGHVERMREQMIPYRVLAGNWKESDNQ